ncbi:MAG: hypothetical protein QX199_05015 [Methylococcaceae bacterium]
MKILSHGYKAKMRIACTLAVLTFGEIEKGIEKAVDLLRKRKLQLWVEQDLKQRFENRIISIDLEVSSRWGAIQGEAELVGRAMPTIDGLIQDLCITALW